MGKMYFPDEVPSYRNSHTDQLRGLERKRLERERNKVDKELKKVILIWTGVIVLIIVEIILHVQLLG